MKFQIGQEVMIISGVMTGRKATVLSVKPCGRSHWYTLEIKNMFDKISYLECELEPVQ